VTTTEAEFLEKEHDVAGIDIRPMQHSDLAAVESIEREAFKTPWSKNMLSGELTNAASHPFSLYLGTNLVGYLFLWHVADECHLVNIAISAAQRQRGLGRRLIEFTIEWAKERKCAKVLLEVRESNRIAIALYEKLGFCRVGVRKNYYRDVLDAAENAILMTRQIKTDSGSSNIISQNRK